MSYAGKLFARVNDKGAIAFVRFTSASKWHAKQTDERYDFLVLWSHGDRQLPTDETGQVSAVDIEEMIEEGMLFEVNESTSPCPAASA